MSLEEFLNRGKQDDELMALVDTIVTRVLEEMQIAFQANIHNVIKY